MRLGRKKPVGPRAVVDSEGETIGSLGQKISTTYLEVERKDAVSWFIAADLLSVSGDGPAVLNMDGQERRQVDLFPLEQLNPSAQTH